MRRHGYWRSRTASSGFHYPHRPTSRSRSSDALLDRRQRALKRMLDVSLASMTLLVMSPLMLLIAIVVSISSPGPVIYRHRRVGQGGPMLRRPQVPDDVRIGRRGGVADHRRGRSPDHTHRSVAAQHQARRAPPTVERHPRGDVPGRLEATRGGLPGPSDRTRRRTHRRAPGITGAATLYFRDEERLLSLTDDPKRHYDEVIYPLKVRMDLDYYRTWSLKRDLAHLIVTALSGARWLAQGRADARRGADARRPRAAGRG